MEVMSGSLMFFVFLLAGILVGTAIGTARGEKKSKKHFRGRPIPLNELPEGEVYAPSKSHLNYNFNGAEVVVYSFRDRAGKILLVAVSKPQQFPDVIQIQLSDNGDWVNFTSPAPASSLSAG